MKETIINLLVEDYSNEEDIKEFFNEGWKFQQVKHTVQDNFALSYAKFKKKFGLSHNFTIEEISKRTDARLSSLVNAAETKEDIISLIKQLEQWIKASSSFKKLINGSNDVEKIRNHNQKVNFVVTKANMKYLALAKAKLNKM